MIFHSVLIGNEPCRNLIAVGKLMAISPPSSDNLLVV